ncbi:MAG: nucleotidyltransferase family protein [Gammaproteobacteria bacterium]
MATVGSIHISESELGRFCRRHGIRKLALFGSVQASNFSDSSDIDVLVEFEPDTRIGYLGVAGVERELSVLLAGRQVNLRTPAELSPYFRDDVQRTATVLYARE